MQDVQLFGKMAHFNRKRVPERVVHAKGTGVNYQPNSFDGPVDDYPVQEPPLYIDAKAARWDHREGNDESGEAAGTDR